jgi:hypothetical protein
MSFDLRVLNKAYKEILTLRSKILSLLKIQKVINNEKENLSIEDFLYLPKSVLVYLLILKTNNVDLSKYEKKKRVALNALNVLLTKLNDKINYLEELYKIDKGQDLQFIKIDNKVPRRVFKGLTHRQMAEEIMRKFRERNKKS